MFEELINLDQKLFLFLNNLGSLTYDPIWLLITKQANWTPFFLVLLYFIQKKLGWRKTLTVLIFVALLILITDQTCNLFKNYFERLRPCNNPNFEGIMRAIKPSKSFSYFSGHAANSSAVSVFLFLLMKNKYKHFYLIFLFPIIFAYSRIYLGLHYPLDILTGYFFGTLYGFLFYKLYEQLRTKEIF